MFCLINKRIISVKISLFFQEINFVKEFPGSNFLLPSFLTGGKWDFQVANLLLAFVNFELWYARFQELVLVQIQDFPFVLYIKICLSTQDGEKSVSLKLCPAL